MVLGRALATAAVLVAAWRVPPMQPRHAEQQEAVTVQAPAQASPPPSPAPLAPSQASPAASSPPQAVPSPPAAADFTAQVRTLVRIATCAPDAELPGRFEARVVEQHCKLFSGLHTRWQKKWLTRARPFLDEAVPADLPQQVVYPFGGGDLLTALVVFPRSTEITTLSLEPSGDARAIDTLTPADLPGTLLVVRKMINHIFEIGHSKTSDMSKVAKSLVPGDLTYSIVALSLLGNEVVAARYFRLNPDGTLAYLTREEVAGLPPPVPGKLGPGAGPSGRRSAFANVELVFRARSGGPLRTFRHITANLDDAHMNADGSVLRHLEAKGPVAAMTKAASYLLWWKEFGKIRDYLLGNMVWMVSDSTGIPPDEARAAGFEQIPFGKFKGPFLGGGKRPSEVFRKLWDEEAAPLAFRFGYPDSDGQDHLLITRRATVK
jgi:hypothetical protein